MPKIFVTGLRKDWPKKNSPEFSGPTKKCAYLYCHAGQRIVYPFFERLDKKFSVCDTRDMKRLFSHPVPMPIGAHRKDVTGAPTHNTEKFERLGDGEIQWVDSIFCCVDERARPRTR
jgi:hypothetical protein